MAYLPSAKAQNVLMKVYVDDQGSYAYQGTYVISWVLYKLPSTVVQTKPTYVIVSASGNQPFDCSFEADIEPDVWWRVDVTVNHYYGGNWINSGFKQGTQMDSDAIQDPLGWSTTVELH
jgi:hypothetical protein